MAGVELPLHEADIRVISALMDKQLTKANDLRPELLDGVTIERLRRLLRYGRQPAVE